MEESRERIRDLLTESREGINGDQIEVRTTNIDVSVLIFLLTLDVKMRKVELWNDLCFWSPGSTNKGEGHGLEVETEREQFL